MYRYQTTTTTKRPAVASLTSLYADKCGIRPSGYRPDQVLMTTMLMLKYCLPFPYYSVSDRVGLLYQILGALVLLHLLQDRSHGWPVSFSG